MVKFRIRDLILILSVLSVSLLILLIWLIRDVKYDNDLYANVYYKDECIYSLDLDKDTEIKINGYESEMIIVVKNNKVWVKESGCENQICVNTGKINKKRQTITCLPNKVWIKIGKKVEIVEGT